MVNIRKQNREQNGHNGGQDGGQGWSDGGVSEELAEIRRHIAEIALAQHERSRAFTTMHTSSVLGPGIVFLDLHLPEEAAIAGAHIENRSTATLTVYEGPGAGGRIIGIVKPDHYKRIALADYISSLSIVADGADASGALVTVTLSTRQWSPVDTALS